MSKQIYDGYGDLPQKQQDGCKNRAEHRNPHEAGGRLIKEIPDTSIGDQGNFSVHALYVGLLKEYYRVHGGRAKKIQPSTGAWVQFWAGAPGILPPGYAIDVITFMEKCADKVYSDSPDWAAGGPTKKAAKTLAGSIVKNSAYNNWRVYHSDSNYQYLWHVTGMGASLDWAVLFE